MQDEASLILKLYELRREETMRKARDWYIRSFNPETLDDVTTAMFGEHSGHLRMVMTYWDMAAALVNHGSINLELFNSTNAEHFAVFAKLELLLNEMRAAQGPNALVNLEKLIDATPGGRERCAQTRARLKGMRDRLAARQTA